jgi:hypothetical protein
MLAKPRVQHLPKWAVVTTACCLVVLMSATAARAQAPAAAKTFAEIRDLPGPNGTVVNLAQQYNTVYKKSGNILRGMRTAGKAQNPDEEKLWDDYYKFRIAEMTWKENLDSLPKKREEFKKDFRVCVINEQGIIELYTRLNNQLLQMLPVLIANGAYPPVTRVNWTLMLGDLNERESQGFGATASPAIPNPSALLPLMTLFADAKLPDEIRAAALVGILRQFNNPSKSQKKDDLKKTIEALRGIVNLQADAKVKNRPGIIWLRRQSCVALGSLAWKSEEVQVEVHTPAVVTDVHELVRDPVADLNTRCMAAHTLGSLRSRLYPKNFVRPVAHSMADLLVAIAKVNPDRKLSAPELTFMLTCVQTALTGADQNRGLAPLAEIEKDSIDLVKALQDKVNEALKIFTTPNVQQEQLADAINSMGQALEKLVPSGTAPSGTTSPMPPAASVPAITPPPATAGAKVGIPKRATGTVGMKE